MIGTTLPSPKEASTREGEKKLVKTLLSLHEVGKAYKGKRTGAWKECYDFVRRRQWEPGPSWKAYPVVNLVLSKSEYLVGQITENRPVANFVARPNDDEIPDDLLRAYANVIQSYEDYQWARNDMDQVVEDCCKYATWWSVALYHTYYDSTKDRAVTEAVDPHRVVLDPRATDVEDSRWIMRDGAFSRAEVERRWPKARDRRDDIHPGNMMVERESDREEGSGNDLHLTGSATPGSGGVELVPRSYEASGSDSDIQVLDIWVRDGSVTEGTLTIDDPDTGGKARFEAPEFPHGRHIVLAGGVVVLDDPNPYDHKQFPYVAQFCIRVPGEFWCISYVENLISPQKAINKLYGMALEQTARMSNSQWLYPKGSIDDPEGTLIGEAGARVEYNPILGGSEPKRLEGKGVEASTIHLIDMFKRNIDEISGSSDVNEGRKPTGITAGVAIESLQQASQTRVRPVVRHLERAIEKVAAQRLAITQQYTKAGKKFRVQDPNTGEFVTITLTKEAIEAQYDIEIVAGSSMPKNREARFRQAVALKEAGVFDEQAVLEYTDHPYAQKVLRRQADRRKMAMEIALATGMQPAQIDPGAFPQAADGNGNGNGGGVEGPPPMRKPQVATRGGGFFNQGTP